MTTTGSPSLLHPFFESAPVALLSCAADGTILQANTRARQIPGCAVEGQIFADGTGWLNEQGQPMRLADSPLATAIGSVAGACIETIVGYFREDEAMPAWFLCGARRVESATDSSVLLSLADISTQRRYSFREIVDLANDAVIVCEAAPIDPPGPRISYVNAAFCALTGYTAAEAIGQTPRILQGEGTDRETLDRIRAAVVAGQPTRELLLNYAKDGRPYWLDIAIAPLHDPLGRVTHFVAIERDVSQLKQEALSHRDAALRDPLTDLLNRRGFLESALLALRECDTCSVIAIDLDRFKDINDGQGHAAGDAVLRHVAGAIEDAFRKGDLCARFGGEEFVVLLPDTAREVAMQAAERLRSSVASADDAPVPYTLSAGVAEVLPSETLEQAIARADEALYAAKAAGRNRVVGACSRLDTYLRLTDKSRDPACHKPLRNKGLADFFLWQSAIGFAARPE